MSDADKKHGFPVGSTDPDRTCVYCGMTFGRSQYYLVCKKAPGVEPARPTKNIFERPYDPQRAETFKSYTL